ncbi:MAG: TetR/AcrR family transcriptional regulator [Roseibium sp.]|nr:TetR/AcrR family transcriptional regulator [Roseibium sp.]
MATAKTRQKILDTFLTLLGDHAYGDVTPTRLARAAGVKLSVVRECYPSKKALVEAFANRVDVAVLDEQADDMHDQPARDRLFDVLMTRIDHLAAHKNAVRALMDAVREDPALALDFNPIAVRSQRWMLEAAGIELTGFKAQVVAQGLALAFARVLETWLDETDEGMPRTMARLDKELDRGEDWVRTLDRLESATRTLRSAGGVFRRRRRRSEPDWQTDDWGEPIDEPGADAAGAAR